MKCIINQRNLRKVLGIVDKITTKTNSLPILNNILIKTENGRVKISATNLEIGINCFIGARIEEVGEITVPARIISDFIAGISDDKITLSTKNNSLFINSNNYKTQIFGLSSGEFPIIPKIKNPESISISARVLKESLIAVFDAIALSETRPELSGVYVNINTDSVIFAATDSFRLAERVISNKNNISSQLIIPRNTISELLRILNDLEGEILIKIGENQISFSTDEFELVSRLIEGNYPDYKKVIPDKTVSRAIINKEEFNKNIRLAGLFSSTVFDIKLICVDDKVEIYSKNPGKGEIKINTQAVIKSQPFDVSLNFHYLLDGLKTIPTGDVILNFTGQGSPLIIKSEKEDKEFTYLIMPLRT